MLFKVTHQRVPAGSPVSSNVTACAGGPVGEKVMLSLVAVPLTITASDSGLAVYPETVPTVNEYVPFGSAKVIVEAVELAATPFNVTEQLVAGGSPVSSTVTGYVVNPAREAAEAVRPGRREVTGTAAEWSDGREPERVDVMPTKSEEATRTIVTATAKMAPTARRAFHLDWPDAKPNAVMEHLV